MKRLILFVVVSLCIFATNLSSLWACSPMFCGPSAQMLGKTNIPANIPALVIGPRHCYWFVEADDDINSDGVPYDINPNESSVRLINEDTNTRLDFTVAPSPHRDDVYHVVPQQLQPNTRYRIEVDLPKRAWGDAKTWSNGFNTTPTQTLPDASLSLSVDISTPQWHEFIRYTGEAADCSPYTNKVYERVITGTIPAELEPWKDILVWRVKIDDRWEPLSPFKIQGRQQVIWQRRCPNQQDLGTRSYTFEAFIPGTSLTWRSNTVTTTLDCPPEDMTMGDMSEDMADMTGVLMDMSDMPGAMDMTPDIPSDMATSEMTKTSTTPSSGGGCTQALQPRQNPVILLILGLILVSLRRPRV